MERKGIAGFELKAGKEGAFRARIATLGVIDRDKDVTLPGAFPIGKEVAVSAYMHTSWQGALPVGKARIAVEGDRVYGEGQFFLDTTPGRETYLTVRRLGSLQEWSYGFEPKEIDLDALARYPGAARVLRRVEPFEISPVLLGAGVNTGTEYLKSWARDSGDADDRAMLAALRTIFDGIEMDVWELLRPGGR